MNVIIYTILEMLTFFRWRAHLSVLIGVTTLDTPCECLIIPEISYNAEINQDCPEAKA